jgi:hypothetical protein
VKNRVATKATGRTVVGVRPDSKKNGAEGAQTRIREGQLSGKNEFCADLR